MVLFFTFCFVCCFDGLLHVFVIKWHFTNLVHTTIASFTPLLSWRKSAPPGINPSSRQKKNHLSGPRYCLDFFFFQLSWPFLLPDPACPIMCWNGCSVFSPSPMTCTRLHCMSSPRDCSWGVASTTSDILRHSTSKLKFCTFFLVNEFNVFAICDGKSNFWLRWLKGSASSNEPHSNCWEPKDTRFSPC